MLSPAGEHLHPVVPAATSRRPILTLPLDGAAIAGAPRTGEECTKYKQTVGH